MTQLNQVRGQLLLHGEITSWEAITKFHITRLSEYIRILRHEELMNITDVWERKNDKNYKRYIYKVQ
jgi:hypothetical protein